MDKNSVDKLFQSLSPEQRKKVESILSDKSRTEKLLSSPQAQALLKKLTGENK